MSVIAETRALRRRLSRMAARPEWDLLTRHDLLRKKPPSSLPQKIWRLARRLLAAIRLVSPHVTRYPWLSTLKHAEAPADTRTVLIWAAGADTQALRAACEGFSARVGGASGLVPVLVTDIADFAYFSRLGWLVEYLPALSGDGPSYKERKQAYLAWRYRRAVVLPLSAGLASEPEWKALLKMSKG